MTSAPATTEVRITSASGRATIVVDRLAASLRRLTVAGHDLVEPTDGLPGLPGMAGATLAPWPNRVEDAHWWQGDRRHDLDVSEPDLGNANHGLLAGRRFDLLRHAPAFVELGAALRQPRGYPFDLDVVVRYDAEEAGVTVTTDVVNAGRDDAPVALGAHPYLRLGSTPVEQLLLTVDATHGYRLDARHIPRERFTLGGTASDVRQPTPVAAAPGHGTFERDPANGRLVHALTDAAGRRVELWADPAYRWTQLYRADDFPSAEGARVALAVEPMTAPPNALRTGEGLRWLAPAERWRVAWGIRMAG